MPHNDQARKELGGLRELNEPSLDPTAQIIDDYLRYLDGLAAEPTLDGLSEDERREAEALIELLVANYDTGVPGPPPAVEDRILVQLRARSILPEVASVQKLAAVLPDAPSALGQALSYLDDTGMPVDRYLERWSALVDDRYLRRVLHRSREGEAAAPARSRAELETDRRMAATWWLSLDHLRTRERAAWTLLKATAFLAPGAVPSSLFVGKTTPLPASLQTVTADDGRFDAALGTLRRFSLATEELDALLVDRVVQALVRSSLDRRDRRRWTSVAVRLVYEEFPAESDDARTWPDCARLLPHSLAAASNAQALSVMATTSSSLLERAGTYLLLKPEFQTAKVYFERALAIRKAALGADHPEVATSLDGLGFTLRELWQLNQAVAHFERALAIRKAALGADHPEVATSLDGLGFTLRDLGDLHRSRSCFERALAIRETALGTDHPDVTIALDGLGLVACDLRDARTAKVFFERALTITVAVHGREHPRSATLLNNLGLALRDLGDLAAARDLFARALAIRQPNYGPEHPKVGTVLNNLGLALRDLGDLVAATELFERALAIYGAAYGWDHPKTSHIHDNLRLARHWLGEEPSHRDLAPLAAGDGRQEDRAARRHQAEDELEGLELMATLHSLDRTLRNLESPEMAESLVREVLRYIDKGKAGLFRQTSPNQIERGIAAVDVARLESSAA
jgi:tetratricopeptide (TPR) repeat protein